MKFLLRVFSLVLISTLVLESEAWIWRRRRRRHPTQGCSTPPTPAYSTRSGCSYPYINGEICRYSCRPGYRLVSGSTTRTCSNGAWSGTNLICRPLLLSCPGGSWTRWFDRDNPSGTGDWETLTSLRRENAGQICSVPTSVHARVISTQVEASVAGESLYAYDTTTGFVCRNQDQHDNMCLDYEVRFCCPRCSTPPTPAYSTRSGCYYPYTNGEVCRYSCRPGYRRVSGTTSRTCSNGAWSGTSLVCRTLQWPVGTYGLPQTNTGCPEAAGVTWRTGYRYHDTEDDDSNNYWTSGLHFPSGYWRNNMYQKFCMKTYSWQGSGNWPTGSYCIFKKGGCPSGFQSGEVFWDDEDSRNTNRVGGELPHGQYDRNTLIRYCCRNDGSAYTYISLPNRSPFYLFRYRQGCQRVAGMRVREEYFRWDDEDDDNCNRVAGAHPYDSGGGSNHRLHYCYYWP